jgi:RNAse (barnase) inhibitor barstar
VSELAGLLHPEPPSFHLTSATTDDLGDSTIDLIQDRDTVAVRRIRGTRCRTTDGLFDELAAALQFPAYFGANWNALSDVLADLRWLPAEAYLFVIEDADVLLADETFDFLPDLLVVLADAVKVATPTPFHYLLRGPAGGRISTALTTNGIPFDTII